MVQGCRYLRRSTNRWLLSKNSTTRLEGHKGWHGAGLLWNCSIPITNTKGIYTLALTRLLVDHDHNIYCLKLIPWRHVRLVSIINPSPSLYSIHVITHSRMLSAFTHGTVLLPNDDALPTTDASTECFEENLLPNGALLPNSAHMSISFLYQFLVLTMSNPFKEILWFQHKNLFSRVSSITRLVTVL
jgi:hypothetical protein